MRFKMKEVQVVALHVYPGEDASTQVLEVCGLLTPANANKLQIREACYTEEGIPRNFDGFPSPSLRIDGADIIMEDKEFRSTLIHKLKVVKPKSKKQQGVTLELTMRIHFGGKEPVKPWLDRQGKEPFVLDLSARQEDLAFGEKEADDEPQEDDASQPDVGCTSCNAENPMGIGGFHLNGQKCTKPSDGKEEPESSDGPALASAREGMGGTHQRGGKGRARRGGDPEAADVN